jgi:hypothetical protein
MNILNVINSILAYSDPTTTDNPQMRAFDFTRKFSSIQVSNPTTDFKVVAPGASLQLFNGTVSSSLDNTSVVAIQLLPAQISIYRVSITSGPAGFRIARTVSGLGSTTVTINNNAIAVFDFGAATLSGVVPGDILRISGIILNDTGPFAFSPVNSGFWTVIGVSGTKLSCVRPVGDEFQAVNETVTASASDVQIYSAAGVQVGNKVSISGTLSPASQRTYVVQAVTPSTFDIMSSIPLPNETALSYVPNSFVFYSSSKRMLYLEVDQDAVVQVNADSSNNNSVNPIAPGRDDLVGYFSKFGDTYAATVVNRSVNPMNLKWFTAE